MGCNELHGLRGGIKAKSRLVAWAKCSSHESMNNGEEERTQSLLEILCISARGTIQSMVIIGPDVRVIASTLISSDNVALSV